MNKKNLFRTLITTAAILRIVTIRESDDNLDLLAGMLDQTYRRFRDRPGVDAAIELGLTPYVDPASVEGVQVLSVRGHRAVAFVRESSLFLIWGGSAAKSGVDSDLNPYVETLIGFINAYQPQEVLGAAFSRFVRSSKHGVRLREALVDARTTVISGGQVIDMATSHGQMLWDFMTIIVSMERDEIEKRMTIGWLYAARRGAWLLSDLAVPPGYEVEESEGLRRLRPTTDPAQIEAVRDMITVLATPATARRKCEQLVELGITGTSRIEGVSDEDRLLAGAQQGHVSRLNGLLEVYRTGVYRIRRNVERFTTEEIAGFPIHRPEEGGAYVEVEVPVGLPEGGWAPPAVLEAWRHEAARPARNPGGSEQTHVKPLTGMGRWVQDGWEYALLSDGRRCYDLRRRRHDPETAQLGWYDRKSRSERVAAFDAAELHGSLADGVEEALTSGVHIELRDAAISVADDGTPTVLFVDEETRLLEVSRRAQALEQELERAADLAVSASSEQLRTRYEQRANAVAVELAELQRTAEPQAGEPGVPDQLVVHGQTLLRALATLRAIDTTADRELNGAIRTILEGLRFELDDDARAKWHMDVHLPTDQGLATLRGVSGTVARWGRRQRWKAQRARSSAFDALRQAAAEGASSAELFKTAADHGLRLSRATLAKFCAQQAWSQGQRAAFRLHPASEVRQVLARQALGEDPTAGLPGPWVDLLLAELERWPTGEALRWKWMHARQPLLDALGEASSPLTEQELGEIAESRSDRVRTRLGLRLDPVDRRKAAPYLPHPSDPVLAACHAREFSALECPCGSRSWRAVFSREFVGGVCTGCAASHDGSLILPGSYRGPFELSLSKYVLGQDDAAWLRAALPDGPFTMLEWSNRAGMTALSTWRDRFVEQGVIERLGPDPDQAGPGMVASLYRRAGQDQVPDEA